MVLINFKKIATFGVGQDAITTATTGEQIFNFGLLTTTGDLASDISAYADNVTIRNFGHIETFGLGAPAIFAVGQNEQIENYGYVATHGGVFDPNNAFLTSDGLSAFGDQFRIANYGTVRMEGSFAAALTGGGLNGVVANYGHVQDIQPVGAVGSFAVGAIGDGSKAENFGDITAAGDGLAVMLVRGEAAVELNTGEIRLVGAEGDGMLAQLRDAFTTNNGTISVTGDSSFGILGRGDGHHISNTGSIETHGTFAVGIAGTAGLFFKTGQHIDVVNTGRVSTHGDAAIGVALGVTNSDVIAGTGDGFGSALDGIIENHGSIATHGDGAAGVLMVGDGHHLTNSGLIVTNGGVYDGAALGVPLRAAAIVVSGNHAVVDNTSTGVIQSENSASAAVELNVVERDGVTNANNSSVLNNSGLIQGTAVAVLGGSGQETVVNHGQIVGDVMLGAGDDTFVFGKGGHVTGDVYLGSGNNHVVVEGGSGVSHIADISVGDTVDVSAFFSNFSQLASHLKQHGSDVFIKLDSNDTLVLEHTQLTGLHLQDLFVV